MALIRFLLLQKYARQEKLLALVDENYYEFRIHQWLRNLLR
jgi:hypothetical protein